MIEQVGLAAKRRARARTLSGGQLRRLDLALALIGDPEVLFLDEPTTGFDPNARREAWDMIAGLRRSGTTVLLTSHYLDEVQHLARPGRGDEPRPSGGGVNSGRARRARCLRHRDQLPAPRAAAGQ